MEHAEQIRQVNQAEIVGSLIYSPSDEYFSGKTYIRKGLEISNHSEDAVVTYVFPELTEDFTKEIMAIHMISRHDSARMLDFESRRLMWRRAKGYWLSQLTELNPSIVCFSQVPHEFQEFALWESARQLGLKTWVWTYIPFLQSWVLTDDFLKIPLKTLPALSRGEIPSIDSKALVTKIALMRGEEAPAPSDPDRPQKQGIIKTSMTSFKQAFRAWANSTKVLLGFVSQQFKSGRRLALVSFFRRIANALFYKAVAEQNQKISKSLLDSPGPNLGEQYAIFFLHYEPELAVNPLGYGITQLDALQRFRNLIPRDIPVYAAEHPLQKVSAKSGFYVGKPEGFYQQISAIPGVHLVDGSRVNQRQRDGAIATGTITGTAAFEQAVRGYPAVIYGYVWFSNLPNVLFRPESFEEVAKLKRTDHGELLTKIDEELERLRKISIPIKRESQGLLSHDLDTNAASTNLGNSMSHAIISEEKRNTA